MILILPSAFHMARYWGMYYGIFHLRLEVVILVGAMLTIAVVVEFTVRPLELSKDVVRCRAAVLVHALTGLILLSLSLMLSFWTHCSASLLVAASSAHLLVLMFAEELAQTRFESTILFLIVSTYITLMQTSVSNTLHS
ncbi:Dolichol kinase [Plasmodiophora brassicae]|nr:hypothetical protein PBRA_006231 [Plasmodiophora brassicae]